MGRQRGNAVRCLALVVGLASVLVVMLLWGAGRGASSGAVAQASHSLAAGSLTEPLVAARYGGVSAAWASTEPTFTEITDRDLSDGRVWPISQYGVTVTFPAGSLSAASVFTFTPELSDTLPLPSLATPYFFDIRGTYKVGGAVSPKDLIWVEIQYDESVLGPVLENSLHIYHWSPGDFKWSALRLGESSNVDPQNDLFTLKFKFPGHFGIGGYREYPYHVFLPIVLRSTGTEGSP